jgi:hypothetical protein
MKASGFGRVVLADRYGTWDKPWLWRQPERFRYVGSRPVGLTMAPAFGAPWSAWVDCHSRLDVPARIRDCRGAGLGRDHDGHRAEYRSVSCVDPSEVVAAAA